MTGPEHYRKAEQLLASRGLTRPTADEIAAAQVHATLAMTAAVALAGYGIPERDAIAWRACAAEPEGEPW